MLPSPCGAVVLARASPHPPTNCLLDDLGPTQAMRSHVDRLRSPRICAQAPLPIVGSSLPTFYGLGTAGGQCRTHLKIGGTRSPP